MTETRPCTRAGTSPLLPPLLLGLAALVAACDDPGAPRIEPLECTSEVDQGMCVATVASGLRFPLQLEQPPGDDRIFVAEQAGRIRTLRDDRLVSAPFLDIVADVQLAPEQGLVGMALHPAFASNGHVFVTFTDPNGDIRVQRFTVGANPDALDVSTRKEILVVEREAGYHNSGLLRFGPDGMLWMTVGDATRSWEAQNLGTLLGSLIRIDVDGGDPYAIPPDNPFVGDPDARPEIWAFGLRNPWRFSFESGGRVVITDVGESTREELNVVDIADGGHDFGWPHMEGTTCHLTQNCDPAAHTMPAFEYGRDIGCSILGGTIYRGDELPALQGRYMLADFCGWVGSLDMSGADVSDLRILDFGDIGDVTTLGTDTDGRVYVLTYDPDASGNSGFVGRIQPAENGNAGM